MKTQPETAPRTTESGRPPAAAEAGGFPVSLTTATPEEGFALAIKLSRLGVKAAQPDMDVLRKLRPDYANNADSLIAASHVVATHYQTIAAANRYWTNGAGGTGR